MHAADLRRLAALIIAAQDGRSQVDAFSSSGHDPTIHDAYEVLWLVHEERLRSGWRPVGRKIGFTNKEMWSLFDVDQPVWAFVYDRTYEDVESTFRCPLSAFTQPTIEPEIVLRLRAAPPDDAGEEEILDCIERIAHGIEMVQCHYPHWTFTSTDAICDSSFHGKFFVGTPHPIGPGHDGVDELLENCEVGLHRDGALIEVGHGRNVLGSPALAVSSLIAAIRREGARYPIEAGEIIATGTMTKACSVQAGEHWRTRFDRDELQGLTVAFV